MTETDSSFDPAAEKAREWWDSWADDFQELHEGPSIAFGPGASPGDDLGLLGDLEGERAIELGCGGGQFGVALAKRGAEVTGVDVSETQLAYARKLAAEHDQELEFVHASVTDMAEIPDGTYDLAVSAWAFQWVEDLRACFDEAYRVLDDDGRLVFSVDHPYYRIFDPDSHEFRRSYFDDSPRRAYSEGLEAELVIYQRRISEIVNGLTATGFTIEELREPGYEDPDEYENDALSNDPELMSNVPPTLVVSART